MRHSTLLSSPTDDISSNNQGVFQGTFVSSFMLKDTGKHSARARPYQHYYFALHLTFLSLQPPLDTQYKHIPSSAFSATCFLSSLSLLLNTSSLIFFYPTLFASSSLLPSLTEVITQLCYFATHLKRAAAASGALVGGGRAEHRWSVLAIGGESSLYDGK